MNKLILTLFLIFSAIIVHSQNLFTESELDEQYIYTTFDEALASPDKGIVMDYWNSGLNVLPQKISNLKTSKGFAL